MQRIKSRYGPRSNRNRSITVASGDTMLLEDTKLRTVKFGRGVAKDVQLYVAKGLPVDVILGTSFNTTMLIPFFGSSNFFK